ncbi:nuclear transport factor 2 family protein [Nocardia sp. NPDC050793]|uniref:nuclear transport factor 2 family protein n=1 Tax=Nocardia sp. NPDC050793 TaxID=3155159 RepID=UPI0033CA7596
MSATTKDVIEGWIRALNTSDLDGVLSRLTEDVTWHVPGDFLGLSGVHRGHSEVVALLGLLATVFEPGTLRVEPHRMITGEGAAALECTTTARVLDGREYRNRYAFLFDIPDGRISAIHEYLDTDYARRVLFPDSATVPE